ncbi:MAG: hypothetical protein LBL27_04680, partial [Coriobacteriales bacterium]|nr:hypothetical protein [Coriobacteriales bacterium]
MRSAVATTFELDDVEVSVRELAASIREQLTLEQNSVGILLCDADADGAGISAGLESLLGIPIAGMTSLATFSSQGYHEAAVVLTVLTAVDVHFTLAASASFDDSYEEQMAQAYQQA